MTDTTINAYSVFCRLFGNLLYRSPTDEMLQPTLMWLTQGNLIPLWGEENDDNLKSALKQLSENYPPAELSSAYAQLFSGDSVAVAYKISDYSIHLDDFLTLREKSGMPTIAPQQADHVAHLLLCASWLEDQEDSDTVNKLSQQLLSDFLLPILHPFLGQVQAHSTHPFYRSLSKLCHEIIDDSATDEDESEVLSHNV